MHRSNGIAISQPPAAVRWLPRLTHHVRTNAKRHGLGWATAEVAVRAVNQVAVCRVLKTVAITRPDPAYMVTDPRYCCRFLTRDELTAFSREPGLDLPAGGVDERLARGDECFGILHGAVLAAYGWYSMVPGHLRPEVTLHFAPRFVYMHSGFTHPDYRGQRLHAVGMTLALQAYRDRGFQGLVSYVEATNRDSLKSVYRMGYQDCGTLWVIGVRGRYVVHVGAGARAWGFRLEVRRPA